MSALSTITIKIGGGEGIDPTAILNEAATLIREGHRVVIIHGGSHETNIISERLGHPPTFITSPSGHTSRRTDRATLEIFEMVYCGKVNKAIVEHLQHAGINAIGLSGIDAGIWRGARKNAIRAIDGDRTIIIRDDLSGRVDRADGAFLNMLLDAGKTPVLTPPALSDDGIAMNVDADRAAAATAIALRADELYLLSNVPGVLADPSDPTSLIAAADSDRALERIRNAASGRMKNKVLAAEEALAGGVARVTIGSARGDTPLARARAGAGTVFTHIGAAT